ncbi:MAG: hypothetical protein AAGD07_03210 [Planctomycetota bacterium]
MTGVSVPGYNPGESVPPEDEVSETPDPSSGKDAAQDTGEANDGDPPVVSIRTAGADEQEEDVSEEQTPTEAAAEVVEQPAEDAEAEAEPPDPTPRLQRIVATLRSKVTVKRVRIFIMGAVLLALVSVLVGTLTAEKDEVPPLVVLRPDDRLEEMMATLQETSSTLFHIVDFEINDRLLLKHFDVSDESFHAIDTVLIDRGKITDQGVIHLSTLPNLTHLRLRESDVTDAGIDSLLSCKKLWILNLPHSRITRDGLAKLIELPRLSQLRIGSPVLTNDVCRTIAKMQQLRSLHLIGVPVTDEGLRELAAMPRLESLYLDDSAVTDVGWDWLFEFHPELHVHVNQQHHDRDPHSHQHH